MTLISAISSPYLQVKATTGTEQPSISSAMPSCSVSGAGSACLGNAASQATPAEPAARTQPVPPAAHILNVFLSYLKSMLEGALRNDQRFNGPAGIRGSRGPRITDPRW